jgi:hypothetical protein
MADTRNYAQGEYLGNSRVGYEKNITTNFWYFRRWLVLQFPEADAQNNCSSWPVMLIERMRAFENMILIIQSVQKHPYYVYNLNCLGDRF